MQAVCIFTAKLECGSGSVGPRPREAGRGVANSALRNALHEMTPDEEEGMPVRKVAKRLRQRAGEGQVGWDAPASGPRPASWLEAAVRCSGASVVVTVVVTSRGLLTSLTRVWHDGIIIGSLSTKGGRADLDYKVCASPSVPARQSIGRDEIAKGRGFLLLQGTGQRKVTCADQLVEA
eukprot:6187557-Pleurochrysis_carterae.AAC.1